ncbi:MAG TPA: queuosine precursor transporter [bacterium]|nr:queuosine precursor transporter [Candidatus Omnitrophota bacterium]HOJ59762.1 queuosine precursor transporter [bacterium]HOL96486.1 queuosine precursor transporter [bacterium]HPP01384.1 queuosine precursor transporter [bacterium]
MRNLSKRDLVFIILGGLFITNAILGELIGGKLIQAGPFTMSIGVIPWPVVFLTTDLINEYYGKKGVRLLTLLTAALIIYAFVVLFLAMLVPAAPFSPVTNDAFRMVFSQSLWIIAGSLTAFLVSQFVDVFVFWIFRGWTGGRQLWLRATGSTAVSQCIDSFVITAIAFWVPGKLTTAQFLSLAAINYSYKFMIAVALTPLIYLFHALIDRFLGEELAHQLLDHAVQEAGLQPATAMADP